MKNSRITERLSRKERRMMDREVVKITKDRDRQIERSREREERQTDGVMEGYRPIRLREVRLPIRKRGENAAQDRVKRKDNQEKRSERGTRGKDRAETQR